MSARLMKKLFLYVFLSLLWCNTSFALLDPPIRSYFDKMEKDQWIKYRIYNRCAAVYLHLSKTADFSDEGEKKGQVVTETEAMSDLYHNLAILLHKKILNLEESNYSRGRERLNYWVAYYKTRTQGTYIGNDINACYELSNSDEHKELFDEFIKTIVGIER